MFQRLLVLILLVHENSVEIDSFFVVAFGVESTQKIRDYAQSYIGNAAINAALRRV
jgi:hypothetical protein